MGFTDAIKICLAKYVDFKGRARRSEYWYFELFSLLAGLVAVLIDLAILGHGIIEPLLSLALFLPSIAVTARRLHDTDRSGWWMLISFIPLIGIIVLLIWFCTAGENATNRFGPVAPTRA